MPKSLLTQNPWLRDPKTRDKILRVAAASSSAVEGIYKPHAAAKQQPAATTLKRAKSG